MKLVWTVGALTDLEEIADYIALAGHRKSRRVGSRRDFRRGLGTETKLYRDTTSFRRHRPRRKDQARRREDFSGGLLDKPAAARRWAQVLAAMADQAAAMPFAGRRVPEFDRDDVREMIKRGYRVIYQE